MDPDEHFMRAALNLAEESLRENFLPVGAVVTIDGLVVGGGRKRLGADPYFEHAEVQAMREALRMPKPRGSDQLLTLYSTLEPCIMCFGTALHAPIDRVVFALEDPGAGATGIDQRSLPSRHRERYPDVRGGVLRGSALALMQRFLATTRNPYWRQDSVPLVALVRASASANAGPFPTLATETPVAARHTRRERG